MHLGFLYVHLLSLLHSKPKPWSLVDVAECLLWAVQDTSA